MNHDNSINSLEHDLERLYTLPEPDLEFMAELQKRLAKARAKPGRPLPRTRLFDRLRSPYMLAVPVITLAMVSLLIIGPQRAWAMTVYWLSGGTGYNSNVGFAPADATLELAQPVEIRRGSAVFQMGSVLFIQGQAAQLNFSIQLSPEIYAALEQNPGALPDPHQTFEESMPPYRFQTFNNWIQTPDNTRLSTLGGMVYLKDGQLFSEQGYTEPGQNLYTRYELVLPAKLADMIGAGPGDWVIPFDLKPMEMVRPQPTAASTQPVVGEAATPQSSSATAATQPAGGEVYKPTLEAVKVANIDVQLTDVALTDQETAIRISLSDQRINLRMASFDSEKIHLEDEMGNHYAMIEKGAPADADQSFQRTLFFEPLKPGAKRITITIDSLIVLNSALLDCPDQTSTCQRKALEYTIQSTEEIRPGLTLTPHQSLELPGFPGQFLTLEQVEILPGDGVHSALLVNADWQYQGTPAMKLVGVSANLMRIAGEPMLGSGGVSHSGIPIGDNVIRETYILNQGEPSSALKALYLDIGTWEVELSGPWVLNWDIPQK